MSQIRIQTVERGMKSIGIKKAIATLIRKQGSPLKGVKVNGANFVKASGMAVKAVAGEPAMSVIHGGYKTMTTLQPGTRVRVVAPAATLKLRSATGVIVRPDRWQDYYIIRLDLPALSYDTDGPPEDLAEIREHVENLKTLACRGSVDIY